MKAKNKNDCERDSFTKPGDTDSSVPVTPTGDHTVRNRVLTTLMPLGNSLQSFSALIFRTSELQSGTECIGKRI